MILKHLGIATGWGVSMLDYNYLTHPGSMEYTITYKRIKNGYAKLQPDGSVTITIPTVMKNNQQFHDILIKKAESLAKRGEKRTTINPIAEDKVLVFGEWVPRGELPKNLNHFFKETLYAYSVPLIEKYAILISKKRKDLSIRKVKTKWGHCTSDQRIMLNRDLIHLPTKYAQYVIVHEVAHLQVKNHSKDFWDLVEELMPGYKEIMKELKQMQVVHD